jgi:hypothetical protein
MDEFFKWFWTRYISLIVEKLVDKTRVEEMTYGMLFPTTIKIYWQTLVSEFFTDECFIVVSVWKSQEVE